MGHQRRFERAEAASALPLTPDLSPRRGKRRNGPIPDSYTPAKVERGTFKLPIAFNRTREDRMGFLSYSVW